jgi:hypothetical protein
VSVNCSLYVASAVEVEDFRREGWVPDEWQLELGSEVIVELSKMWEPICAVLSAADNGDLAQQALLGGGPIGDPDYTGFGPARLQQPDAVHELAAVLQGIDEAMFRDLAGSADATGDQHTSQGFEGPDHLDDVVSRYLQVRDAYGRAADRAHSVVVWMD